MMMVGQQLSVAKAHGATPLRKAESFGVKLSI
jgi:hypothetical protein